MSQTAIEPSALPRLILGLEDHGKLLTMANGITGPMASVADQLINELSHALGLTVFLITHDLDTLYAICDRVAVLADRKVVAVGTIPELLALDHQWIQDYFKGPRGRAAATVAEREEAGA